MTKKFCGALSAALAIVLTLSACGGKTQPAASSQSADGSVSSSASSASQSGGSTSSGDGSTQQPDASQPDQSQQPDGSAPAISAQSSYDFSQPVPEREAVDNRYFDDAAFVGDSRTDGLRLYSGIKGADFYCYKGLTVFEMDDRAVVELDGGKYTVEQALEKGPQYAKIYISLGINELGYFNDEAFHQTFGDFLKQVKASQPGAVVYLENLVPVNAEKCAANKQPYYVNNDRVAAYNAIFPQLAEEYQVVLLDVADALTDENGILPADATVDGVHFTKAWYQKWLAYLMEHTVDADCYAAGQTAAEGANET